MRRNLKSYSGILMILLVVFVVGGCATFMLKDDLESTPESRVTADYLALKDKMASTKANIVSACLSISERQCRKAKRIFNYAEDVRFILGYYVKAIVDPENKVEYVKEASKKVLEVIDRAELDIEAGMIIEGIDKIAKALDEEDPTLQALEMLGAVNNIILPAVTSILLESSE